MKSKIKEMPVTFEAPTGLFGGKNDQLKDNWLLEWRFLLRKMFWQFERTGAKSIYTYIVMVYDKLGACMFKVEIQFSGDAVHLLGIASRKS